MYDPTFTSRSVRTLFTKSDHRNDKSLNDEAVKDAIVRDALKTAKDGFVGISLGSTLLRGKTVYWSIEWRETLVLRKLEKNIRRITRVRQSDRSAIVRSLRALCSEGIPFRIYKLDIRNFYESISTSTILDDLKRDIPNSPITIRLVKSFFDELGSMKIVGLPRGMAISACLAEYSMRGLDRHAKRVEGVFYYARYVDDIVIVSRGDEDPTKLIEELVGKLHMGLKFNQGKTKIIDFGAHQKDCDGTIEHEFNFLGYNFVVHKTKNTDRPYNRIVELDIAPKKTSRIKTKLILAARQYLRDNKFKDFEARLRIVVSAYTFIDHRRHRPIRAGVLYSYNLISPSSSHAIPELDIFLKRLLLSKKGKLFCELNKKLSDAQRKKLLTYSFNNSLEKKVHFSFTSSRLADLIRCWKYA